MKNLSKHSLVLAAILAVMPASPIRADIISDWNDTAIRVIKAVNPNPIFASRALAMTHVAQFDAVNAVVGCYEPYAATLAAPGASPEAAAAQAAYHVLTNLYPSQISALDAALAASLSVVPDGATRADGIALGNAVANVILALRANDGSTASVPYTPGSGPGVWVPTPPAFAPALLPHWRYVTPWTMTAPEQFRPGPPPALDSATYTADFNEMKAIGAVDSSIRTPEQTDIALFHIEVPGFTLGSAARYAVAAHPLRLVDSARLFALLYMSMGDALISVWDAKFAYNYWRPVTAIRAADTDGNPATDPDPAWMPLAATPRTLSSPPPAQPCWLRCSAMNSHSPSPRLRFPTSRGPLRASRTSPASRAWLGSRLGSTGAIPLSLRGGWVWPSGARPWRTTCVTRRRRPSPRSSQVCNPSGRRAANS